MDAKLVERITRLVLEKLEETTFVPENRNSSQPNPMDCLPLTNRELEQWDKIASSIGFGQKGHISQNIEQKLKPLNTEEIQKWNKITTILQRVVHHEKVQNKVKFHSY